MSKGYSGATVSEHLLFSNSEEVMGYYVHKSTKKKYAVLQESRMKFGDRWVDGVVYLRDGTMYCRPRADFFLNFDKEKK